MSNIKKIIVTATTCGLLLNTLLPTIAFASQVIEENEITVISSDDSSASQSQSSEESESSTEISQTTTEQTDTDSSESTNSESSSSTINTTTSSTSSSSPSSPTNTNTTTNSSSQSLTNQESSNNYSQGDSESASTNDDETTSYINYKVTSTIAGEDFVKLISKDAQQVAKKNGLYASVMIAQASLESGYGNSILASKPYYNLFGIKGSNNGKSINMPTMEESKVGTMYQIRSNFQVYDSYKASLESYAKLLKNGITGNPTIYAKTWRENAKNYREATRSLTGVYATDSDYHKKLNAIIVAYKLTKYDNNNLAKDVNYSVKSGDTLDHIAQTNNTTLEEIAKLNKQISNVNVIHPGETVVIKTQVSNTTEYDLPLDNYQVTSNYGKRTDPSTGRASVAHNGIDLAANIGSEISAVAEGVVKDSGFNSFAGNYIILEHSDGFFTSYFHQSKLLVKKGMKIAKGDIIGLVGSTGDSTGSHLHFAVSESPWTNYIDPEELLTF